MIFVIFFLNFINFINFFGIFFTEKKIIYILILEKNFVKAIISTNAQKLSVLKFESQLIENRESESFKRR